MQRRILYYILLFFLAVNVNAQKRVGDYVESLSNNIGVGRSPRALQYTPENGDFVCVNGTNRFTRALYGSNTDYRIETSDRPVFAIYKSKNYRNLRFFLTTSEGHTLQLDSTSYCKARYGSGKRCYILKDASWPSEAELSIDLVALPDSEGAIWHFRAKGFKGNVVLTSKVCNIAIPKLQRNGDIGADKPGCFEHSPKEENLVTETVSFSSECYAALDFQTIRYFADKEKDIAAVRSTYENAVSYFAQLSSRISFVTPDPYLNTLGGALVLAADGAWDGETWLHGAIGWRMPLAGWRAGYLGDVLGWNDRAISHFNSYANSQVTDVPVIYPGATQDASMNLARAEKKWGTEMYSTGYICRNPNKNNQMHHYDMNLNYIDELMWHFQYDADTAYMRRMWPVITRHLAWEKLNFDSDNDHLYDAYCCIWASDALFYSDGAVTHSSAYNYRGNLLAARIAEKIGEDPTPYYKEAEAILHAMNSRLWLEGDKAYVPTAHDFEQGTHTATPPHWAEYQDKMGLQRVHPDAALWSIYTPIDCGAADNRQKYEATRYVDSHIPHLKVEDGGAIISTSDWMPYSWSINNVASAEIMHTALAFFEAGRAEAGYSLLKSNVMDQMYYGASLGNFGQISYYDAARGECYRDFGDNIGISSRALVQGLFGIVPDALSGECVIRPGFPLEWDSVEVRTPYLIYIYKRISQDKAEIRLRQSFAQPLMMKVRINGEKGEYTDYAGNKAPEQVITFPLNLSSASSSEAEKVNVALQSSSIDATSSVASSDAVASKKKTYCVDMQKAFNANVSDIFRNEYLSPRPQSTSLEMPVQGVGEWCHPKFLPEINDSVFRTLAHGNTFEAEGVKYLTPQQGHNIAFTSLWDNYPQSVTIPCKATKASKANLLLAGSTNHMQTRIANAIIVAEYQDGTSDTLTLVPPFNWCPIEQDYYVDSKAFCTTQSRPLRVCFSTGTVSRDLGSALHIRSDEVYGREIPGGAATILTMPLNPSKKVKSFTLTTLSNDVVIGLMAITLE